MFNSSLRLASETLYGRRADQLHIEHAPVFVIGHWRTGTTWLHELLVKDVQFSFPTTYQCMVPHHFLLSDRWLNRMVDWLLPENRPMDNMRVSTRLPQEDEFALMNLGEKSPYLEWAFINNHLNYEKYLTLNQLPNSEQEHWKKTFRWFVQRLAFQNPNRLVLKSPGHTARVATLLEIFPNARFIHMVRNPMSFIPSPIRMWTNMADSFSLQVRRESISEDLILDQFQRMYDQFELDRSLLTESNFCELRYEDLVTNPMSEVENVYQQLHLGNLDPARPAMEKYLASVANYQPNEHQLPDALHEKILLRTAEYSARYGYT
jgi:HAMP domain-containing protein